MGIIFENAQSKRRGVERENGESETDGVGNFFHWLIANEVIQEKRNPMHDITNTRISSPLPEILFEDECRRILVAASSDPRTYLLFLLFLDVGIKLEELFALKVSNFDFSNKYSPEMMGNCSGCLMVATAWA